MKLKTIFMACMAGVAILQSSDPVRAFATGRERFASGNISGAIASFELAVASDPGNSSYVHWLGRAYGRRAESANLFFAPHFAVKARVAFEKAVKLDPRNIEALNDLFEYYLAAPGFLGGGLDRASATAELIRQADVVEYEFDLARIAEKKRQPQNAELHYRRAMELAPADAGRVVDLARFLESMRRHAECDALFERAHTLAPKSPVVWFEQAKTYVASHRKLDVARTLLRQYLAARITLDDPPHAEAARLLQELPAKP